MKKTALLFAILFLLNSCKDRLGKNAEKSSNSGEKNQLKTS